MNIKPLYDYVVIKALTEEVTKSGIVLPDTLSKDKPEKGVVVAVGDGKQLDNGQKSILSVAAGDQVMFKKYSANEIKVNGEDYLIVRESDIVAIIS
ncbi:MAG: co-chaperone GroES [bacterium]